MSEVKRTIVWALPLQFFVSGENDRDIMGTIKIEDNRLDLVLSEALKAHPAFTWDEARRGYVVDLSERHPKQPEKGDPPDGRPSRPATASKEPETAPKAPGKPPDGLELATNPKWRGTDTGYMSRLGWRLDLIKGAARAALPHGARHKFWRLSHDELPGRYLHYESKAIATEAILDGTAGAMLFYGA